MSDTRGYGSPAAFRRALTDKLNAKAERSHRCRSARRLSVTAGVRGKSDPRATPAALVQLMGPQQAAKCDAEYDRLCGACRDGSPAAQVDAR